MEMKMGSNDKNNLNWFSSMFNCFSFKLDEEKTAKETVMPAGGPEATMIAAARHFSASHKALFITDDLNGKEAMLVIQKRLFASDLDGTQNRLNMPLNQVETHDFLTENEKRDLENKKELTVSLLGPRLQMYPEPMQLKIWNMKSSDNYVLKTKWNSFMNANKEDLKVKRMIQVWSYRREEQLCFAMACV
ncbi:hypothetical protein L2E82_13961 [Cichorium intybus]|uniref:Uncharacterized protein n=1 Tax=Cichorium intybus TaxID=13427 RepID=A0ACB9EZB3_CICIN|nr:hypothetical protein L2E82_13961 [Cichorium intybus]